MKKFWEVKQSVNNTADVFIYGEIVSQRWDEDETTAASFQRDLRSLGDVKAINLHLNSPGGSVFEGIAIGNMLKQHKAHVTAYVDALAASIASVIAVSCDEVVMPENSMMMIHNPWCGVVGNSKDLRKQADDLDAIGESSVITYLAKGKDKLNEQQIRTIMDEETWLSADGAFEIGLCDKVEKSNQIAACVSEKLFKSYQKVPKTLVQSNDNALSQLERIKIANQAKENQKLLKEEMENL